MFRCAVFLAVIVAAAGCGKKSPDTPGAQPAGEKGAATNKEIVDALRQRSYDASETVPGVVVRLPDVYLVEFNSSAIGAGTRQPWRGRARSVNSRESPLLP